MNILAHELRTPLDCVCWAHDPKSREYRLANLVENGAQTLASRLDELLDLARFAIGAFTIHPNATKFSPEEGSITVRAKGKGNDGLSAESRPPCKDRRRLAA